jgi:pimeloyl-ACP methyl ester carboxylesterase
MKTVPRPIRWLAILAAIAAALYVVGIGGYGFTSGADQYLAQTADHPSCETPGSKFGWAYEAVNYDLADDATMLAANPDPTKCTTQGTKAGTAVMAPDGTGLAAWYIPAAPHEVIGSDPNAASTTGPTLVIVHGGKSNKSGMLPYAPAFHDAYNLLIVDLRNSGRSGGTESTGGLREQTDVRAMIDWLEQSKRPLWLAVMGNSNGAASGLAEALTDPRVKALILDSMHASIERQLGNVIETEHHLPAWPSAWAVIAGVNYRLGDSIQAVDPIRTIVRFTDRPLMLTHGLADIVDRPADSLDLNVAAARAAGVDLEVHTCAGAGHGLVVFVCADDWTKWVRAFLAAHGGI